MEPDTGPLPMALPKAFWTPRQVGWWLAVIWMAVSVKAQTCETAGDMPAPVRSALESTAKRYFDLVAHGQAAALQQNAIPSLAADFGGIEALVKENQPALASAQATVRSLFLLTVDGSQPLARAEFLCGVFGSAGQTRDSAVFVLSNLPPGKYAVVVVDASGSEDARALTLILQQPSMDWKLAGLFVRAGKVGGHDANWFAQRAREFKTKGQTRNAWLYLREAIVLTTPADIMSTLATDKLYDEAQAVQPTDLPIDGNSVDLVASGTTYKLIAIFPLGVGGELDLVVRYQAADISNTFHTFQANNTLINGLVAKFPEFRDAFAGVAARAVDPSGQGYGSMLPMKEIEKQASGVRP